MSDDTTQKPANKSAHKSSSPLLLLLVLFADAVAVAELFGTVRWANGIACPHCAEKHINIHANYKGLKRYRCEEVAKYAMEALRKTVDTTDSLESRSHLCEVLANHGFRDAAKFSR